MPNDNHGSSSYGEQTVKGSNNREIQVTNKEDIHIEQMKKSNEKPNTVPPPTTSSLRSSSFSEETPNKSIKSLPYTSSTLPRKPNKRHSKDHSRKSEKNGAFNNDLPPMALLPSRFNPKHENGWSSNYTMEKSENTNRSATLPRKMRSGGAASKLRSINFSTLRRKSFTKNNQLNADDVFSSFEDTISPQNAIPGVMKVFSGSLGIGANYKSFLVTPTTSAKDVVVMTLERFDVPACQNEDYVICEVVGNVTKAKSSLKSTRRRSSSLNEKHLTTGPKEFVEDFKEDYIRPLSDDELPITIQTRWMKDHQENRRFEIRKKSEIYKDDKKSSSHCKKKTTEDIDLSQFLLRSLGHNPPESESEKITSFDGFHSCDEFASSIMGNSIDGNQALSTAISVSSKGCSEERVMPEGHSDEPPDQESDPKLKLQTSSPPYLLTLQGNGDTLVHSLDKPEILIGSDVVDFKLEAPDIQRQHCVIKTDVEVLFSDDYALEAQKIWCVTVRRLDSKAEVRINGVNIGSAHTLQHGDLLSIGKHHLFMYKDPTFLIGTRPAKPANSSKNNNVITSHQERSLSIRNSCKSRDSAGERTQSSGSQRTFPLKYDDNALNIIFSTFRNWGEFSPHFKLAPATILVHCAIHSCQTDPHQETNNLLEKIVENLKVIVKDVTDSINEEEQVHMSRTSTTPVLEGLDPLVYWMTNTIEIFNFFNYHLQMTSLAPEHSSKSKDLRLNEKKLELKPPTEEGLREVVTITFKKLVFNVTTLLYKHLSSILDCNPFVEDQQNNDVSYVIDVLTHVRNLLLKYDVCNVVVEQLFSYLFFFINVYLFNTLMDEESGIKYFNWEMGIRIRGNFERIETLAAEWGYSVQSDLQFEKLSALTNLLATPKDQIAKSSWSSFRRNFSSLSPAQLNRVLSNYHFSKNKPRPRRWFPQSDEDLTGPILEGYGSLPPFILSQFPPNINHQQFPNDTLSRSICQRITNHKSRESNQPSSDVEDSSTKLHMKMRREQPDGRDNSLQDSLASTIVGEKYGNYKSSRSKKTPPIPPPRSHQSSPLSTPTPPLRSHRTSESSQAKKEDTNMITSREIKPKKWDKNPHSSSSSSSVQKPIRSKDKSDDSLSLSRDCKSTERSPHAGAPESSKNIVVVCIEKNELGLGVGLVDGLVTSLKADGIYVRFLIPEGYSDKKANVKHHDVVRCWPREGRLQLGDRILAVNGISLVKMNYKKAIRTLKDVTDDVRLLIGRCGYSVAMKVLLPSK